jgi:hypothetical protein
MHTQKHGAAGMKSRNSQYQEREMSSVELADEAGVFVRRMVARESRGWGDQSEAQRRLESRYGLSYWALEHLRTGKAKSCETSLYMRVKAAFIDHCGKQAARLLHEAETAKTRNPDVDLAGIEDQIRALAARLEDAKANQKKAVR